MAKKTYQFDPNFIWLAGDGEGNYESFDSEQACKRFANENNEEMTVGSSPRSNLDSAAPEMYVCLNRVLEHLLACQLGKADFNETTRKLMAIYPRIDSIITEAKKDKHLKEILKALDIENIA